MIELLELIKKKDRDAIAALYSRYGKKLYGFAIVRWHVSEDEAWELVYKTLYKFIEVVDRYSFESENKLQSFIFQSFINNLRNLYNEKKKNQQVFVPLEDYRTEGSIDSEEKNVNANENNPYMICLKKVLELLDDWKRILMLMRAQDHSYEDIASYTGKPPEQLKVYYMRAKKMVVEKVKECVKTN